MGKMNILCDLLAELLFCMRYIIFITEVHSGQISGSFFQIFLIHSHQIDDFVCIVNGQHNFSQIALEKNSTKIIKPSSTANSSSISLRPNQPRILKTFDND